MNTTITHNLTKKVSGGKLPELLITALPYMILGIVCAVLYANTLNAPFIFDDTHMIVQNILIHSSTHFIKFFQGYVTSFPIPKGMLRPLLMLTFYLNYQLTKLNPSSYHIFNILLHFLNSCFLYRLLCHLYKKEYSPFLLMITLLFTAHPLNTETITYISSRSDLLLTLFMILSIFSFLKGNLSGSLLYYCAALLSKESALCMVFFLCGYLFLFGTTHLKKKVSYYSLLYFYTLIISISLLYFLYKSYFFAGIPGYPLIDRVQNILTQSFVSFLYLKLLVYPYPLNILHPLPPMQGEYLSLYILCFMGILILITLILGLGKKYYLAGFGLFWFLIGLLPKFAITLNVPAAEHHSYLPNIGIFILISSLVSKKSYRKPSVWLFSGTLFLIFSILTVERNYQYQDPLRIWQHGVNTAPSHVGNWINLGAEYQNRGQLNKAKQIYQKTLRSIDNIDSDWQIGLYLNIAGIFYLQNNYEKSMETLTLALTLNPTKHRLYQIYNDLALLYEKQGNTDKALSYWKSVIEMNPYAWNTYLNIGKVLIEQNNLPEASSFINQGLKINPGSSYGYFLMGTLSEKQGKTAEAITYYNKSIQLEPDWFYSHYYLSLLYSKLGNPQAIDELQITLKLNPQFTPARKLARSLSLPLPR